MAVNGKTGRVRTPRELILRTGYRKMGSGNPFPTDTDVFVATERDGWGKHPEVLELLGATLIEDALQRDPKTPQMSPGRVWSLGTRLRCMLPWEYDTVATVDGRPREVAFELKNRLWQGSGLQCEGDGGETSDGELLPGEAICRNDTLAAMIAAHTGQPAVQVGRYKRNACWGPQCSLWKGGKDQRAVCHTELRLWFLLVHPTTDETSPHYLERLAWVQLSSGSEHGMWDIESGFRMLRAEAGRTAKVPWYLQRIGRTVTPEGKRTRKYTLMVTSDREAVIVGKSSHLLADIPSAVLERLRARALQEIQLHEVLDILPRDKGLILPGTSATPAPAPEARQLPAPEPPGDRVTNDRDEEIERTSQQANAAAATAADEPEEPREPTAAELNAKVEPEAREVVKRDCGLVNGDKDSLERVRELLRMAFDELGDGGYDATGNPMFSAMRVKHAEWMRRRYQELQQLDTAAAVANADPDDAPAPGQVTLGLTS